MAIQKSDTNVSKRLRLLRKIYKYASKHQHTDKPHCFVLCNEDKSPARGYAKGWDKRYITAEQAEKHLLKKDKNNRIGILGRWLGLAVIDIDDEVDKYVSEIVSLLGEPAASTKTSGTHRGKHLYYKADEFAGISTQKYRFGELLIKNYAIVWSIEKLAAALDSDTAAVRGSEIVAKLDGKYKGDKPIARGAAANGDDVDRLQIISEATDGSRNRTLFTEACAYFRENGITDEAQSKLTTAGLKTGLEAKEVEGAVASAKKAVGEEDAHYNEVEMGGFVPDNVVAVSNKHFTVKDLEKACGILGYSFRMNTLGDIQEFKRGDGEWQEIDDPIENVFRHDLSEICFDKHKTDVDKKPVPYEVKNEQYKFAMAKYLSPSSRQVNPFKEWLDQLPRWDGKERLAGLICDTLTGLQNPYYEQVGRMLICAIVRRAYAKRDEYIKFDYMPALIGKGRIGKSTWVASIMPSTKWHTYEINLSAPNKEFTHSTRGFVIGEVADLDRSKGSLETVKGRITRAKDSVRLPYYSKDSHFDRRIIFIATSDSRDCLDADHAGWFRALPVFVDKSVLNYKDCLAWWNTNRNQVFAQALGEDRTKDLVLTPDAEKIQEQYISSATHNPHEALQEHIKDYLNKKHKDGNEPFKLNDLMIGVYEAGYKLPNGRAGEMELTAALKLMGYKGSKQIRVDGFRGRYWQKDA